MLSGRFGDCESGLHVDDVLATPTSMKSPLDIEIRPHHKDEEGSSRRSSVSDEIAGGGKGIFV